MQPSPELTPSPYVDSQGNALPTPGETEISKRLKEIQDLNNQDVGQSAYRTQQEAAQNIPGLQKTQTELQARLTTLANEEKAIPLQLQQESIGRGRTAGGLAPIQTAALRNNAIQSLSVGSLLEASRGNLTLAQDLVDRAVKAKFDPIEEQIRVKTANLNLLLKDPTLTLEEKNRAEAQLAIQEQAKAKVEAAKVEETAIKKIATDAAANLQSFTPTTQYPTIAVALDAIGKAKTQVEAATIAATVGLTHAVSKTASIQEYEYAKANGYTGTYTQYQNEDANRKAVASGTTPSGGYKFTSTQANTGAANAGVSAADFAGLPGEVQNTFINNPKIAKLLVQDVADAKDASLSREEAASNINGYTVPQEVKDYFTALLPAAVAASGASGGGFFGWLGRFFGGGSGE